MIGLCSKIRVDLHRKYASISSTLSPMLVVITRRRDIVRDNSYGLTLMSSYSRPSSFIMTKTSCSSAESSTYDWPVKDSLANSSFPQLRTVSRFHHICISLSSITVSRKSKSQSFKLSSVRRPTDEISVFRNDLSSSITGNCMIKKEIRQCTFVKKNGFFTKYPTLEFSSD